jgi:hypothetical protein
MKVRMLTVLAVAAAIIGCATLPTPDKAQALLVVPVRTGPGSFGLAYEFLVKDTNVKLPVSPQNGVYAFDRLGPGKYVIDRVTVTIAAGAGGAQLMGGAQTRPIKPVPFELTAGTITILPVTVFVTQEVKPDRTTQGWDWIPTKRDEVMIELAKYENFSRWKVAP